MRLKLLMYLLFLFSSIITYSQSLGYYEYYKTYPYEDTKNFITASADNYIPKINEPVKLKLKIIAPWNMKGTIGFFATSDKEGVEFIDGEQTRTGEFYKGQVIEMEATVKFTNKMVAQVSALYCKNVSVGLSFYVDGGFRESNAVEDLRRVIEEQKEWIKETREGKDLKYLPVGNHVFPQTVIEHKINTVNKYEEDVLEETIKSNILLFEEVKKEYDSLDTIIHDLIREKRMKESGYDSTGVNNYGYDIYKKINK